MEINEFRRWITNTCQDAHDKGLSPEDMFQVLIEKAKLINVRNMELKVAIAFMDKSKDILKEIIKDTTLRDWNDKL